MNQRRRKSYVKRPKSQVSIVTAVIGAVGIFLYFVFLSVAFLGNISVSKLMAGVGVISALVCVAAFVKGIEPFRDVSYDTWNRWMGLVLPLVGFVVWTLTYFTGIIFG